MVPNCAELLFTNASESPSNAFEIATEADCNPVPRSAMVRDSATAPPVPFDGVSDPSVKFGCGVRALVVTEDTALALPAVSVTAEVLMLTLRFPAMKLALFKVKR